MMLGGSYLLVLALSSPKARQNRTRAPHSNSSALLCSDMTTVHATRGFNISVQLAASASIHQSEGAGEASTRHLSWHSYRKRRAAGDW
eukprot:4724911-Pleurochrysis_carterae.AAC.1